MIIDNWPVHSHIENLKIITLPIFLPKNITPIRNPVDRGTIQGLKTKYCTIFAFHIIATFDNKKPIKFFNILEVMYMLTRAWDQVSTNIIVNCYKEGKISEQSQNEVISNFDDPFNDLEDQLEGLQIQALLYFLVL